MVRQGIHLGERQEGFTLVELLVAIAMFAMIMIGIFYLWRGDQMAYLQGSAAAANQQDARAAMEQLVRDIRLAGYDPCRYVQQTPAPPNPPGTSCADPGANALNTRSAFDPVRPNVFAIVTAANSIRVRMDRDANGSTADADEDVTFSYNTGAQTLSQNTGAGPRELAQNITSFQLTYFDAAGVAVAAGGGSASDLTIRLVRITLTATAPQTFLGSAANLQSDVRLRDR